MKTYFEQTDYTYEPVTKIWIRSGYSGIAYSDGDEVEQRISSIISHASDLTIFSAELRQHCTDWASLYHLSGMRANILRPLKHILSGDVLEVGAGCGAITRYLGECAANVLALEGSPRRAVVARSRTRDLENVTVLAEKFEQFEAKKKFDVITLIGVLEYANLFTTGEDPALSMLERVRSLLKPKGKLIIAIENQLGLKYFAGAPEDHLGQPMYGIEGRYQADQPQTFGRNVLANLLQDAGFSTSEFLAPFPDYKLPVSIVTERGFNSNAFDAAAFAWQSVRRDPQLPPILAFSPELVWPSIAANGLALDLANSFLIVGSLEENVNVVPSTTLAWHFTTDRRKEFCKAAKFVQIDENYVEVLYKRLDPASPNPCFGNRLRHFIPVRAEYKRGRTLSYEIMRVVTRDGWRTEEVCTLLRDWLTFLSTLAERQGQVIDQLTPISELPREFFDCIPQNIIISENGHFHFIDREWTTIDKLEAGHIVVRALWSLIQTVSRFGQPATDVKLTKLGFISAVIKGLGWSSSDEDIAKWVGLEVEIQSEVSGRSIEIQDEVARLKNAALPMSNLSKAVTERDGQITSLRQAVTERDSQITSLRQAVTERDDQIASLGKAVVERDDQIANLGKAVVERDDQITSLGKAVVERDVAIGLVSAMRASTSWRLTAPIRFVGHLTRGDFSLAARLVGHGLGRLAIRLPQPLVAGLRSVRVRMLNLTGILPNSSANFPAIADMVAERCELTRAPRSLDPMSALPPVDWPKIDICVVTFNSRRWISGFVDSLLSLDYPRDLLAIHFVDNSSTDGTEAELRAAASRLQAAGLKGEVLRQANRGFGAGHNVAMRAGTAPFSLVTNIDLIFEPDSLRRVAAMAIADAPQAAAWELRQKPYEHPKFYDPVTGSTNWNAHACVLLRRSAVASVGGYDEALFMYGEDVELSYRLRRAGHLLRYCPAAVVWHYSYESSEQVKPLQYIGSTFGNLYLRLKYGKPTDIIVVPLLAMRLLGAPEVFPGSRRQILRSLLRLAVVTPKALISQRRSTAHFPFRTWDYELIREGAFVEQGPLPAEQPLVSVITRTYRGRELYLRQALLSVAHQTWSNLEHIVVEDGGKTMLGLCEDVARATGRKIRHIANSKQGRAKAGNTGMAAAHGRWCVFLDDDDLLFAEHVEVLANALLSEPDAVASYAPAWEVVTDTTELAQGRYVETAHTLPAALRQEFDFKVLQHHNYFAIQSVLFERRLFTVRGGFYEDMDALEDWTLWIHYALENRFVYVPKVTSMFRTPADPVKAQERSVAFDQAYPLAQARAHAFIAEYQRSGDAPAHQQK